MASPCWEAISPSDVAQVAQFGARRRDIVMRLGDDLDLRLQEFAGDAVTQRRARGFEKAVRHPARDRLAVAVDQKIFFLNPERKRHSNLMRSTARHDCARNPCRDSGAIVRMSGKETQNGSGRFPVR